MNKPVSFELAKLLKEKNIKIDTEEVLFYRDEINNIKEHQIKNRDIIYHADFNYIVDENEYQTYIIAEVIMLLYEKHKIWISSSAIHSPHLRRGDAFFIQLNILDRQNSESIEIKNNVTKGTSFNSPTEAYEAAIKYCLTELIK